MGLQDTIEQLQTGDPHAKLRALQQLRALARSLDADQRRLASQHAAALADHEQPFVRWNVASTLGALGDESGLETLVRLASQDDHANTRLRAALALAQLGDPRAVTALEALAADPYTLADQHPVRAFAALALGMLAHPAGLAALERLSCDDDPQVRWHATVALGELGAGVEALSARATDPVPFVRAHTAIALAQIGDPKATDVVETLTNDKVERVAKISTQALALLKASGPESHESQRQ